MATAIISNSKLWEPYCHIYIVTSFIVYFSFILKDISCFSSHSCSLPHSPTPSHSRALCSLAWPSGSLFSRSTCLFSLYISVCYLFVHFILPEQFISFTSCSLLLVVPTASSLHLLRLLFFTLGSADCFLLASPSPLALGGAACFLLASPSPLVLYSW